MEFFKVSDFVPVNKAWGNFRKLEAKIVIPGGKAFIGLFRENDDGRESISVHDARNDQHIVSLGFYWVDTDENKQKALNAIFETIMSFK